MAKVVLTGGSGFLGRALLKVPGIEWTVISRSEKAQLPLRAQYPEVRFVVGDICDEALLARVFPFHEAVIHAAALKHVDLSEREPRAYTRVNVEGTRAVVDTAARLGMRVVGISTDKACEPYNVYGLTKLLMERLIVEAGGVCVRYGNVFGSDGSVVRRWQETGQITVTDPEMTRFFFPIEDAVEEVLWTLRESPAGTVMVPPLGAARMEDLALQYQALVGGEIMVTGPRPGEKKHELLLSAAEGMLADYCGERAILGHTRSRNPLFRYSSADTGNRLSGDTLRQWLGPIVTPATSTPVAG